MCGAFLTSGRAARRATMLGGRSPRPAGTVLEDAMEFFPVYVGSGDDDEPEPTAVPVWMAAPEDVVPGIVPVELVLGRSRTAAVLLTGIRAFPSGLSMTLGVRLRDRPRRGDLNAEIFDGPYQHDMGAEWQAGRLKWGFELSDGRRVTNVDPTIWDDDNHRWDDPTWEPDRPQLSGGGGGGGDRSVDREYWLWPLPPAGRLRAVCQWLDQGIDLSVHDLDAQPFLDAAARAVPLWPEDTATDA
jgi:hypothetical protein